MKIKTSELIGAALDWAVAKCQLGDPVGSFLDGLVPHPNYTNFHPSTDWAIAGPIIEREEIGISRRAPCFDGEEWEARGSITAKGAGYKWAKGPTPLVSAMRAYVASRLGDEIEIPEELR